MLFVVLNLVNTLGGYLLDRLIVEESLRQVAAGAASRASAKSSAA